MSIKLIQLMLNSITCALCIVYAVLCKSILGNHSCNGSRIVRPIFTTLKGFLQ